MVESVQVLPDDSHNRELVENLRPSDWQNSEPADRYNLLVVGAGPAGLVAALGAAGLGAKVALVEKHLLGGDCLNVGCVPSKTLIRSGRVLAEMRSAAKFGVELDETAVRVHFHNVMERVRSVRAYISHHDSAKRITEAGVDLFLGGGQFTSDDCFEVDGKRLRFKKAVIATGARPQRPPIEGLGECDYRTNENIFELTELPARLAVIGGGPIGCELAQAFRRLGSEVTIIDKMPHFLSKEDADAANILGDTFKNEGIDIHQNTKVLRVWKDGSGKHLEIETGGDKKEITVDEILVGAGRVPNVENLGLEAAHVDYDERQGIRIDDRLRTTNPRIYAAGDVCMDHKFTHAADAAARIVIQNALFLGRKRLSKLVMPWCTYTEPEIAHVGMYEAEARDAGFAVETFKIELRTLDRALADGETGGFVKIHVRTGKGEILGATIVARHAGEMISEISTAMVAGLGIGSLANTIHPYPTQAEAIRKAAEAWNKTRFTPTIAKIFKKWLVWTR